MACKGSCFAKEEGMFDMKNADLLSVANGTKESSGIQHEVVHAPAYYI